MVIGQKVKSLRIKHGLTQEELADRCELSKGFISQLERDLTSPSIATLMDILECLGTNIHDFFREEQDDKIVFTKNDFSDPGVMKTVVAIRQYDQKLGFSQQWITDFVYRVVMLAKKEKRPADTESK